MDTTDIIYNCAQKLDCDARRFEPMSRHTSFKIGGKAHKGDKSFSADENFKGMRCLQGEVYSSRQWQ